jgi:tRNA G18 (ribose-2'-O)-methylase SpoU
MGLCLRLPVVELAWPETSAAVSDIASSLSSVNKTFQIVIADGDDKNRDYCSVDYTLPTIIVVGSEAQGVSQEAWKLPGKVIPVRIPMQRALESFNAGVAGSIILAEAAKQRREKSK